MAVIRVPKTPRKAFNKSRPISNLLKAQLEHLEAVVYPAPNPGARTMRLARPAKPVVRTEGQAAAYIQELTRQLYAGKAVPLPGVPLEPPAAGDGRKRTSRRRARVAPKLTRKKRPGKMIAKEKGARKKSAKKRSAR